MRVKKSLNANAVIAINHEQQEFIFFGKGIGYGKKNGDKVDESIVNQTFIPLTNQEMRQYVALIEAISPDILETSREIVSDAEKKLQTELNPIVYLMLSDHISFAIERQKKGVTITNRAYWEVKNYYPDEFLIGKHALSLIDKQLAIQLPEEEAVNIAFHLINAQTSDGIKKDGLNYANLVSNLVTILRHSLGKNMANDNVHYQRLITHLKFFAERFFSDNMLDSQNSQLFEHVATAYPESTNIAFIIKDYLYSIYSKKLPKDELTFLIIHINRLRSEIGIKR